MRTVTITKNSAEQYYAAVMFEDGKEKPKPSTALKDTATHKGEAIGIDLGLTHFAITSDSQKLEADRFFPSSKTCHVCLNQVGVTEKIRSKKIYRHALGGVG